MNSCNIKATRIYLTMWLSRHRRDTWHLLSQFRPLNPTIKTQFPHDKGKFCCHLHTFGTHDKIIQYMILQERELYGARDILKYMYMDMCVWKDNSSIFSLGCLSQVYVFVQLRWNGALPFSVYLPDTNATRKSLKIRRI